MLDLMAQGLTNVGIANRLVVSERTVEAHVRHILLKLDIPETEDDHRRVLAVLAYLSGMRDRSSTRPSARAQHAAPAAVPDHRLG